MKLYLLQRPHENVGYDENEAFMITANSPKKARALAASLANDEGNATWLDPKLSSCKRFLPIGKSRCILKCFNAG